MHGMRRLHREMQPRGVPGGKRAPARGRGPGGMRRGITGCGILCPGGAIEYFGDTSAEQAGCCDDATCGCDDADSGDCCCG